MKVVKMVIPEILLEKIINVVKKSDIEACGIMIGSFNERVAKVKEVMITRNKLNSPIRFEIDPEDLYKAIEEAEKRDMDIVGIFHSHPLKPIPSKYDLEGMRLWPIPWLIISRSDLSLGCYVLRSSRLQRIDIVLELNL